MINKAIPAAETRIATAQQAVTAAKTERDTHPAKLPANVLDPDARRARLRTHRRALQMVLRLLAYNAEHWLATAFNTYLQDPDEYRTITRGRNRRRVERPSRRGFPHLHPRTHRARPGVESGASGRPPGNHRRRPRRLETDTELT